MSTSAFRFDNFSFPVNPENISLTKRLEKGNYVSVIKGSGEFYGEDCKTYEDEIKKRINKNRASVIYAPELGTFKVYVTEFDFYITTIPDLIKYSFIFTETIDKTYKQKRIYTVKTNESLWDIAYKLDIDFSELCKINSGKIKTCFLKPGDELFVPVIYSEADYE